MDGLRERARSALAEADRVLADRTARQAAKSIAFDRVGNAHAALVEAHLRAMVEGYGPEYVAAFLEGLSDQMGDKVNDAKAWAKLPAPQPVKRSAWQRAVLESLLA